MFTGIVEELGTMKKIKKGANSAVFTIRAEKILDDLKTGDSVAVNGICLTVTACLEDGFTADVMHETLNRSALIQLSLGQHVNLERAMPANGRFGGHIVRGMWMEQERSRKFAEMIMLSGTPFRLHHKL